MFSAKSGATALGFMLLFILLPFNANGQWSPEGKMVYMGDLNLAASSASGRLASEAAGTLKMDQSSLNNSTLNNMTVNSTSLNNSAIMTTPSAQASVSGLSGSSGIKPLDLSGYASDRSNKNLAGYKNIMYPISGSRGSTTSTSGGGGCGCGG